MSTVILGLHGDAGAGKSTVAALLQLRGWQRVSCAAPLRAMLASLLQSAGLCSDEVFHLLHDQDGKQTPITALGGKTARQLLQTLGTEWGRDLVSPTLWTDLMVRRIRAVIRDFGHPPGVVVDDVRFPEEAAAIRSLGGQTLRLLPWDGAPRAPGAHRSEQVLHCHRTITPGPGGPEATLRQILVHLGLAEQEASA
jgi:hypothetical protein